MTWKMMSTLAAVAAVGVLALAGCTAQPDGGPASNPPSGAAASGDAARFVACLTAAGVTAKVGDQGYVLVRDGSKDAGNGMQIGTGSGSGGQSPLLMTGDADGTTWVAVESSAYFVDDPDTQDAYAGCERQYPEFAQPQFDPANDPSNQQMQAEQAQDALTFARCARDAGFAWVADPVVEPGVTPAIVLPTDTTEAEFRAVLEACGDPQANLAWSIDGDLSFDWLAVLDDVMGQAVGGGQ